MSLNSLTKLLVIILLPLLFTAVSCNKPTEPPPVDDKPIVKNTIVLKTEWQDLNRICIKFNKALDDTASLYKYTIKRKDVVGEEEVIIAAFSIYGNDTLYIDGTIDTLEMGKIYTYRITAADKEENLKDTSNAITTATLSPTSHDFEWTIDTLGVPGNFLNDIWGFDENNVFAVGGATLPDGGSTVIKWDGEKWSSIKNEPSLIKYGIYGFSSNEIWIVGNGLGPWGGVAFYNGQSFTTYYLDPGNPKYSDTIYALNAVWGASPNDVWAVGGSGTIIHWDGVEWKKVQGIERRYTLWAISGRSSNEVFATGKDMNTAEWILYSYDGNSWTKKELGFSGPPRTGVWQAKSGEVFLIGTYPKMLRNGVLENMPINHRYAQSAVRGSTITNVFSVGHYGDVHHYNGKNWKTLSELNTYPYRG
ncbi:MAG: hypothetical protein Q8Q47_12670, partial [Ignavibacteriaceae bacterium]|nr:hypothetical protein [Ignavibacteriaceae bacterium]